MRDDLYAEATNARDMFDHLDNVRLNDMINQEQKTRHDEIVNQMRTAIAQSAYNYDKPLQPPTNNIVIQPQTPSPDNRLNELANNPDFSVETIQQQASRVQNQQEPEVYISLH